MLLVGTLIVKARMISVVFKDANVEQHGRMVRQITDHQDHHDRQAFIKELSTNVYECKALHSPA